MINWEFLAGLDFGVVWEYRQPLIEGFLRTLFFTGWAIGVGLLLSMVTATLTQSKLALVRLLISAYVEVIRNTPFPVQLFWVHFALPAATGLNLTVTQSALLALVASNVAYVTEIVRAGIESVPKGQWEACSALALPRRIRWVRVILPQALRIAVPALINNTLSVFKMTAVLSILAVNELMLVTQRIATHTGRPVELYTSAAVFYCLFGILFVLVAILIDRRLSRGQA
jgi:polar amino acid transport system permease protein